LLGCVREQGTVQSNIHMLLTEAEGRRQAGRRPVLARVRDWGSGLEGRDRAYGVS
jgi:hypothetical protein